MKTFLTGATGFVGSALLTRLIADKASITALVRGESAGLPSGVKCVVGDLSVLGVGGLPRRSAPRNDSESNQTEDDVSSLDDLLLSSLSHCNVVVHAAARAHIMRDEVVHPLAEYRKVNRDATLALARLAAEAGVKRFVFLSSIGVNGNQNNKPFLETDTPDPQESYAISKYEAEQGLIQLSQDTDLEVVIIRPPLVYGANAPGNFSRLIQWANAKFILPLPLGSVKNSRSLIAIDNLVDFIITCSVHPKAANEIFLISDDDTLSTTQLLKKIARAFDRKTLLLPIPINWMIFMAKLIGREADAIRLFSSLVVDSSKARDLLDWKPVVTMDEALKKIADK